MKMKEIQKQVAARMKQWQKVENGSMVSTGKVLARTDNKLIRLVMQVIQSDSLMHYEIQQWMIDSLEKEATAVAPDDLTGIWNLIQRHVEMERVMVASAEDLLGLISGKRMVLHEYLINFLLDDERKHTALLERLEGLKRGFLP
jgi:hypothetical protein